MKKISQIFLLTYSLLATILLAFTLFSHINAANSGNKHFEEITAQQIRIVEPDGTLRMVISNASKLPGVIVHGKEVEKVDRPQAGMLFYNDEGSENGGLIFSGIKNKKGEVENSGVSLSFDRFGGKQELNLIAVNDKDNQFAGLMISDSYPGEKRTPDRIWVGRNGEGSSVLALMDSTGRARIEFKVKQNGETSINILDNAGKIIHSFLSNE